MGKFATDASGALLLLNLIQVTESISGSVVPLAMFYMQDALARYLLEKVLKMLNSIKMEENNEKQIYSRAGRKPQMADQSDLSWSHYANHLPDYCR